jgi:hypothetical protein
MLLDTSPRNRASQEPDGHRQEWFPGNGTDSQPEALKLLVVSNSWRRNVPPSSLCRARHREEHADSSIMPTLTRQLASPSRLALDFAMCPPIPFGIIPQCSS